MAIILNDDDKLIIITVAATLILITLLATICIVCPWCLFHHFLVKSKQKKLSLKTNYLLKYNRKQQNSFQQPQFQQQILNLNPESQHFHFSIVPIYGTKTNFHSSSSSSSSSSSPIPILPPFSSSNIINESKKSHQLFNQLHHPILNNQFENLTNLAKSRYNSYCNDNHNTNIKLNLDSINNPLLSSTMNQNNNSIINKLPKLEAIIYYKSYNNNNNNINDSTSENIRIHINIKRIFDLTINELAIEPSPYVVALLTSTITTTKSNNNHNNNNNNCFNLQRKSLCIINNNTNHITNNNNNDNNNKALIENEIFYTDIIKRTLDYKFIDNDNNNNNNNDKKKHKFHSNNLIKKNNLKDLQLKLRLMHYERYANDICLGEIIISLKKLCSYEELLIKNKNKQEQKINIDPIHCDEIVDKNNNNNDDDDDDDEIVSNTYTLYPIKEIKGEIMVGICYLPTSKRINITLIKGTMKNSILRFIDHTTTAMMMTTMATTNKLSNNTSTISSSNHQVYYIKVLMFQNGKLIRKKRTSSSIRLLWGKNETISFDLSQDEYGKQMSLMFILSYKMQDSNSPESPDIVNDEGQENLNSSTIPSLFNSNNHQNNNKQKKILDKLIPKGLTNNNLNNKSDDNKNENNNKNNNNNNNNINDDKILSKNSTIRNSLRKESCIGHFILDRQSWMEILRKPRKQIVKWYKLY